MGGWDQIALNARLWQGVKMENVAINQILVNVMMVGKDIYVMNQVASKFLPHFKWFSTLQTFD